VKRRPELLSVYNRKFDIQRAEVKDPKLIGLWFKLVGDTIAKYGVTEEDIFNFRRNWLPNRRYLDFQSDHNIRQEGQTKDKTAREPEMGYRDRGG
jgi:hypothetical protein